MKIIVEQENSEKRYYKICRTNYIFDKVEGLQENEKFVVHLVFENNRHNIEEWAELYKKYNPDWCLIIFDNCLPTNSASDSIIHTIYSKYPFELEEENNNTITDEQVENFVKAVKEGWIK
jgi:hypothetical protein